MKKIITILLITISTTALWSQEQTFTQAVLIIDGRTLTNSCPEQMWQGIFVSGNTNLPQTAQNVKICENLV
jgi:hypothetical protein